jgi:hypothetical protein
MTPPPLFDTTSTFTSRDVLRSFAFRFRVQGFREWGPGLGFKGLGDRNLHLSFGIFDKTSAFT